MFDIGLSELALIAVLALVIAGPERLPGIMRGMGRFAARARSVASALRAELEREVGSDKEQPESQGRGNAESEEEKQDGNVKEERKDD